MTEAEFRNILEQVDRITNTQGRFKIDVVARLTRLKQGLGLVLAEARNNTDRDEEPGRSPGRNAAVRA
jgi:hypothetical protein